MDQQTKLTQTQPLRVNVRQVPEELDDPEDAGAVGLYAVIFSVDDHGLTDAKRASMALDIFHTRQGIECLDDFEIEVIDGRGNVIDPDPGHVDYSASDDGDVEKISDEPVARNRRTAPATHALGLRDRLKDVRGKSNVPVPAQPTYLDYINGLPLQEALWWFIENAQDDLCGRSEIFFALRERVRNEATKVSTEAGSEARRIASLVLEAADPSVLNGMVRDRCSAFATDLNNDGAEAQVRYLLSNGWTEAAILTATGIDRSTGTPMA